MRITSINYSRVFSLGNYENEKIGVEIELSSHDDPKKSLDEARKFVDLSSKNFAAKMESAKMVLRNPDDYLVKEVRDAKEFLRRYAPGDNLLLPNNKSSNK